MICPHCGYRDGGDEFKPGDRVLYGPYPATVLQADGRDRDIQIQRDDHGDSPMWTWAGGLRPLSEETP